MADEQHPLVDRLGRQETLYLGPDENITPEHIEWIVDRARRRGHKLAAAFMSSKPGAGINHKEYGVTCEGVTVFLAVALKAVGIDPHAQDFTVKLTGGPDGDVAGNMIKILHREYGERAKIVGIADGSGALEDPERHRPRGAAPAGARLRARRGVRSRAAVAQGAAHPRRGAGRRPDAKHPAQPGGGGRLRPGGREARRRSTATTGRSTCCPTERRRAG